MFFNVFGRLWPPVALRNACFALSKFLTMPNESYRQRMKQADAEAGLWAEKRGAELLLGGLRDDQDVEAIL